MKYSKILIAAIILIASMITRVFVRQHFPAFYTTVNDVLLTVMIVYLLYLVIHYMRTRSDKRNP